MRQKIILVGLLVSIGVVLFGVFSFGFTSKNTDTIVYIDTPSSLHLGIDISEILTKENYDRIGINPEKYNEMEDFLRDFKEYEGMKINPLEEKFSIAIKKEDGNTLYVPFDYSKYGDVFSNDRLKNLAILDIYTAYQEGLVYGSKNSLSDSIILFESDAREHPSTQELNKIFSSEINVFNYIASLEQIEHIGQENTELLAYLYDLTGRYKESNILKTKICKEYNVCTHTLDLDITGSVVDTDGNNIEGVTITLLNSNERTDSNQTGDFNFRSQQFGFGHLRFKASKKGYSDGFISQRLDDYFSDITSRNIQANFVLSKSENYIPIREQNYKKYSKGRYYLVETGLSKYFIPKNNLYYESGELFEGGNKIDIYLYHFKKESNMENLLGNDTFEPVYGYVGNIMKTFGMPYIQIIDPVTEKELYTSSDFPMVLQNQVYHMKELYEDFDGIYGAITREDMEYLVEYSENSTQDYPIDFKFLTEKNFLRWPAWWALDRKTGIWSNVGHRVLDVEGRVELPFYHFKVQ